MPACRPSAAQGQPACALAPLAPSPSEACVALLTRPGCGLSFGSLEHLQACLSRRWASPDAAVQGCQGCAGCSKPPDSGGAGDWAGAAGGQAPEPASCGFDLLPLEAVALVAGRLERPERQALALSCRAGAVAVASTVSRLLLPGAAVTQPSSSQAGAALARKYVGLQGLALRSCSVCSALGAPATRCLSPGGAGLLPGLALAAAAGSAHAAPAPRQQQQQQPPSGAAVAPHAGQPRPAPAGAPLARCGLGAAQALQPSRSLASFLAAAGPQLPHLSALDLSAICVHSLARPAGELGGARTGLLAAIARGAPRLEALALPGWLWDGLASVLAAEACAALTAAGRPAPPPLFGGASGGAACLRQALALEPLAALASLPRLRSLRLLGLAPVPLEVLGQVDCLPRLRHLSLCASTDVPCSEAAAAATRVGGGASGSARLGGSLGSGEPASTVSQAIAALLSGAAAQQPAHAAAAAAAAKATRGAATVLGSALQRLPELASLSLHGLTDAAAGALAQLASLPSLVHLELCDAPGLRISSLAGLGAATSLTSLKVRGIHALQASSRAALPSQLSALKQLACLACDCDLHLRDVQVLASLPCLTLLAAASFHACVTPGANGLVLPALKSLAVQAMPHLRMPAPAAAPEPAPAAGAQEQQQHAAAAAGIGGAEVLFAPAMQGQQPPAAAAGAGAGAPGTTGAAAPAAAGALSVLCPGLQELLVAQVDDAAFAALAGHPSLKRLFLGLAGAGPAAFSHMPGSAGAAAATAASPAPMPQQAGLGLDAMAAQLQAMRAAQAGLLLPRPVAMPPSAAAWEAVRSLPALQAVHCANTTGLLLPLRDASAPLLALARATTLSLQRAHAFNDWLAWVAGLCLKRLATLSLHDATQLSDRGLSFLAQLPLTQLVLSACPNITHGGLQALLLACPSLAAVRSAGCAGLQPQALQEVQELVQALTGRRVHISWSRLAASRSLP